MSISKKMSTGIKGTRTKICKIKYNKNLVHYVHIKIMEN